MPPMYLASAHWWFFINAERNCDVPYRLTGSCVAAHWLIFNRSGLPCLLGYVRFSSEVDLSHVRTYFDINCPVVLQSTTLADQFLYGPNIDRPCHKIGEMVYDVTDNGQLLPLNRLFSYFISCAFYQWDTLPQWLISYNDTTCYNPHFVYGRGAAHSRLIAHQRYLCFGSSLAEEEESGGTDETK